MINALPIARLSRLDFLPIAGWLTVFIPIALVIGRSPLDISASTIATLFLFESIKRKDFSWAKQPWFAVLVMLWSYAFVRTGIADHKFAGIWEAFVWIRFVVFAAALGNWVLVHEKWRERLFYFCFLATVFLALDALLQYFTGKDIIGHPIRGNRLTATFESPMVGINISWMFFPVMMWFMDKKLFIMSAVYGILCFIAILLSGDRYALLATLCMFALVAALDPRIRRGVLIGGLVVALLAGVLMYFYPEVYKRQVDSTIKVISNLSESRYGIVWKSALDISSHHPWFGVGIRNYRDFCPNTIYGFSEYFGSPFLKLKYCNFEDIHGFKKDLNDPSFRCLLHPHNIYLELLVETGLIGLAGYLAFVFLFWLNLIKNFSVRKESRAFIGIIATLVMRFWPLTSTASFFINWAAIPMWLMIGWGLSYCNNSSLEKQKAGQ